MGVPRDFAAALFWYLSAAQQGHVRAQFNLGLLYSKGEGVPRDDQRAAAWYRKAADQGHVQGQLQTGIAYDLGKGVIKNDQAAAAWYYKAAEQGDHLGGFGQAVVVVEVVIDVVTDKAKGSLKGLVTDMKNAEGAGGHCQTMGKQIFFQRAFNWLDELFGL